jgi:hypothetical protein
MIVRTSGDLFAGLNGWGTLRAAPAAELSFISTLGIDHFELSTREKHQSYSSLLSRDPIRSCHYVGRISGSLGRFQINEKTRTWFLARLAQIDAPGSLRILST